MKRIDLIGYGFVVSFLICFCVATGWIITAALVKGLGLGNFILYSVAFVCLWWGSYLALKRITGVGVND